MDRPKLPALKLPPPCIVTEAPISPLAKETANLNKLKLMRSKGTPSLFTSTPSPTSNGNLFGQTMTGTAGLHTLSTPTTGMQPKQPFFKRSKSEPAKPSNGRRVNLGPGCGMLDWIRLCKNSPNMSGTGGEILSVTEEELSRHCTPEDAWTCIRGKVYNITPYFKFHPGGKEDLLKAAGKDCTILFDEVHKWVNYTSMLKKCYVGEMSETKRNRSDALIVPKQIIVPNGMNRHAVSKRMSESDEALVHSPQSPVHPPIQFTDETDSNAKVVDPPSPIRKNSDASRPVVTLWDWNQTEDVVSIHVVVVHNQTIAESDVVVDAEDTNFTASIKLDSWVYQMEIELSNPVNNPKVYIHSNKIDIRMSKVTTKLEWDSIGTLLPGHSQMVQDENRDVRFRSCSIVSIENVTHDTRLFTLELPSSCSLSIPVGHHVFVRPNDLNIDLERSYTPVKSLLSPPTPVVAGCHGNKIELLIKLYKDGAMSQHLAKLSPGDRLNVSDPRGTFNSTRLNSVEEVLLIAAGSGYTPMIKVINQLLSRKQPVKKVHLIFANKTSRDMIWREEMSTLAKAHNNFTVTHILSSPDDSWDGARGRITKDIVKPHLPQVPASEDDRKKVLICICGPLPFTESVTDILINFDFHTDSIHVFE